MKKYLAEFIGTFFLVTTIGAVVLSPGGAGALAPVAIGVALIGLVYAGGHVSGAHYNPAVTLAVFIRGKLAASDVVPYWVAQVAGGAAAAGTVLFVKGFPDVTAATPDLTRVLVVEFLFTFALCYVILNVATARLTSGNPYYGVAIGMVVMGGMFAAGPVSGAVFNPAVAIGLTIMGLSAVANIWIFLVANFAAAVVAALTFRFMNPHDA